MKPSDVFIAIIPTLDGTGNMSLVSEIGQVGAFLGKPTLLVIQDKAGVAACRFEACKKVGKHFGLGPRDVFRALMVDSDITISDPRSLAGYIPESDEKGYALMASVRLKGPQENVYAGGWSIDPDTPELEVVHPKGIGGLYYGPLFPEYPWKSDSRAPEDVYFLNDNPTVEIRYAKNVKVGHYARVLLA